MSCIYFYFHPKVKYGVRGDTGHACNAVGMIDRTLLGVQHLYKKAIYSRTKVTIAVMEEFDYSVLFFLGQMLYLQFLSFFRVTRLWSTSTRINFIFMPTQLSDGSCYLHDLITLWPCYCTFQGTQRQNIALDNPRLLSCSHGIYFRLF
ncbi:hypothetical protein IFM89_032433, partial [Coptis chinensis]